MPGESQKILAENPSLTRWVGIYTTGPRRVVIPPRPSHGEGCFAERQTTLDIREFLRNSILFSIMSTIPQSDAERVAEIDGELSHVWMVRTFLKHSEEAEEDDELCEVHRELYDYMLALGGPLKDDDHAKYLKQAKKKLRKLKAAVELFSEIQPEISSHTNFQMAAESLRRSVARVVALVEVDKPTTNEG